jgi:hypothetical protein
MKSVLFPIFKHALCILIIGVRRFIILEVSILSPFCFPYLNMPSFQLMCCQEVHHSGSFYFKSILFPIFKHALISINVLSGGSSFRKFLWRPSLRNSWRVWPQPDPDHRSSQVEPKGEFEFRGMATRAKIWLMPGFLRNFYKHSPQKNEHISVLTLANLAKWSKTILCSILW